MKIAVVGAGGVGGYFGGLLAKAGEEVIFVDRGEHGEALKNNGLTVKSVVENFVVKPVQVVNSIAHLTNPDLVIFTVKTYDTEEAARELNKAVGKETTIITFQNGVDNDLRIKSQISQGWVYPGVAYVISARTKLGVIEQTGGLRKLIFGDRDRKDITKLRDIERMMRSAGIDAVLSEDITRDVWKKFVFITAFSGMTAITQKTIGEVLSNPETLKQYEAVVRESIEVARKMEVNLPEDIFEITMKNSFNTAPDAKSSLLIDIERGGKNEIESLNGTLVRLASNIGVAVPMNRRIYEEIRN